MGEKEGVLVPSGSGKHPPVFDGIHDDHSGSKTAKGIPEEG